MFNTESGRKANKKRKRRYGRVTRDQVWKKPNLEDAKLAAQRSNAAFRASLISGGSNNACGCADMMRIINRMDEERKFTRDSVFVDFGSGSGAVVCYLAERFKCKCYGVERSKELVEFAHEQSIGNNRRCVWIQEDFTALSPTWLAEIGATHVFAFDAVFDRSNSVSQCDRCKGCAGLVGASTA